MNVDDLIEVLSQSPNRKVPIMVRVNTFDEDGEKCTEHCDIEDVRFDGGSVVIDVE